MISCKVHGKIPDVVYDFLGVLQAIHVLCFLMLICKHQYQFHISISVYVFIVNALDRFIL